MKRLLLAIVWAVVCGCILTACDHKDLLYPSLAKMIKITITFDWSQVDEEEQPEGMRVAIYEKDNDSNPLLYDVPFGDSLVVELPEGNYRVVTYNYDSDGVIISSDSSSQGITITTDGTTTPDGENASQTPSNVIGSTEKDLTEDIKEIEEWGDYNVVITPTRIVYHYQYEVNGVQQLGNIAKVSASLSNMYTSISLSGESAAKKAASALSTLALEAKVEGEQIVGDFYTFGYKQSASEEEEKPNNVFKLYITDKNGDMHELEQDVTPQIQNARAATSYQDKYLVIDFDFTVPKDTTHTSTGGGAFDVSADDWEDVNEDIIIN